MYAAVKFNLAALLIIPVSVIKAETLEQQIDLIYEVADDPKTPKIRASQLAILAGKLVRKFEHATA